MEETDKDLMCLWSEVVRKRGKTVLEWKVDNVVGKARI